MLKYIIAVLIAIPVIATLIVGVAYAHDEVASADRVSRGVFVVGQDVSRLTTDEVAAVAGAYESTYTSQPVVVVIDGATVEIDPAAAGIDVDEEAVAEQAANLRREDGIVDNVLAWFRSWRSTASIEIPITVDDDAIRSILVDASATAINTPAVDGSVKIARGEITPEYPSDGLLLDVDAALPIVREQLLRTDRDTVELPIIVVSPQITAEDVDDAVSRAYRLVKQDITLDIPDSEGEIVYTKANLRTALRSEVTADANQPIRVYLDTAKLNTIAANQAEEFNTAPVNARIAFSGSAGNLVVVPSIPGRSLDVDAVGDVVATQAASGLRSGIVPMIDGVEADYTTAEAQELGPFGKVSSFTTYHPCCQSRVTNIQRLARAINGSMVQPGETFSINARAGRRTESKGYVRAGAIIGGRVQCCDSPVNVGGGTSQFATTFYNAVFFGCYQDVFHKPHSLYFSRYPYVREATLGFPSPDVKFRNDSASPVYIRASYSSTAITVTLYGNNGGRTCTSSTSGNTVTRTMKHANGTVTRQHWSWSYRQPTEEPTEEPTTTTTEAPAETTTSAGTTSSSSGTTTPATTEPPPPPTTEPPPPPTTEPPPPPTTTTQPPPTTEPPPPTTEPPPTTTAG